MIVPVGIEDAKVRGYPVVTLALMFLCIVAFLWTGPAGRRMAHPGYDDVYEAYEKGLSQGFLTLAVPDACVPDPQARSRLEWLREDARLLGTPPLAQAFRDAGHTPTSEQAMIDALCVEAHANERSRPDVLFGLVPANGVSQLGWFTYPFLHADFVHLVSNLLFFFFLCGPFVEDVFRRVPFLALFMVGGAVAGFSESAAHWTSSVPIVGASGAISACMGAFCFRFAKRQVGFFYLWPVPFRTGTLKLPAWMAGTFWLGQDVVMQLVGVGGSGVAYLAHIGGFVFGLAVAIAWRVLSLEEKWGNPLDDDYQLDLSPSKKPLGATGIAEPRKKDIAPELREVYATLVQAFQKGDAIQGTRRARWLFERATYPRDDIVVAYVLNRYVSSFDAETFSARRARKMVAFAVRHGLEEPQAILEEMAGRATAEDEPAAPAALPIRSTPVLRAEGDEPQFLGDPTAPPPKVDDAPETDTAYHREFRAKDVRAAIKEQLAQLQQARAQQPAVAPIPLPPRPSAIDAPPPQAPPRVAAPMMVDEDEPSDPPQPDDDPWSSPPPPVPSRQPPVPSRQPPVPSRPAVTSRPDDPWGLTGDGATNPGRKHDDSIEPDEVVAFKQRPMDDEPVQPVGWLASPDVSDLEWESAPASRPAGRDFDPGDSGDAWEEIPSASDAEIPPPMIWSADDAPQVLANSWDDQTTVARKLADLSKSAPEPVGPQNPVSLPKAATKKKVPPVPTGDFDTEQQTDPVGVDASDLRPSLPTFLDVPTDWDEELTRAGKAEQEDGKLRRYRPIPKSWKDDKGS